MYRCFFKRLLDIICALLVFIFLWILFIIIAILVRIKMGKPVFFKQVRPGKDGKLFTIYKFRTMKNINGGGDDNQSDKVRITKFGSALRRSSLDEIPEAFNILKGDMSVVGPRPLLVKDFVFFSDEINKRLKVRPGLSGLAQVKGRNNISWEQKFDLDLQYINKISFVNDFKLVAQTVVKAFFKKENINRDGFITDEDYGDYLLRTKQISQIEYSKLIDKSEIILSSYFKGGKQDGE